MSALPQPTPWWGFSNATHLSIGQALAWAGGANRDYDEWVNAQAFVHSSPSHFNIFAEMEFEFQKA